MRRSLVAALAAPALLLSVAACGGDEEGPTVNEPTSSSTTADTTSETTSEETTSEETTSEETTSEETTSEAAGDDDDDDGDEDAVADRTEEWLTVLNRLMVEDTVTHHGALYDLDGCVMEPKPAAPPTVYMGGESPKAKDVISRHGTAYVMHGDAPDVIASKESATAMMRATCGIRVPASPSG